MPFNTHNDPGDETDYQPPIVQVDEYYFNHKTGLTFKVERIEGDVAVGTVFPDNVPGQQPINLLTSKEYRKI